MGQGKGEGMLGGLTLIRQLKDGGNERKEERETASHPRHAIIPQTHDQLLSAQPYDTLYVSLPHDKCPASNNSTEGPACLTEGRENRDKPLWE